MMEDLTAAALALAARDDVRVVVLAGPGPLFCAGGDLDWMKAQIAANREIRIVEARKLAIMLQTLNELPKPVIGRIHGGAFGGGVGLAAVCDAVIAVQGTKFGLTETKLGLIPATISPYVLARLGECNARRVFKSARIFDADEAGELGLVAKVVAEPAMDAAIEAEIAPYLIAAPRAVAAAKALARSLGATIDDAQIERDYLPPGRHLGQRRSGAWGCGVFGKTATTMGIKWLWLCSALHCRIECHNWFFICLSCWL